MTCAVSRLCMATHGLACWRPPSMPSTLPPPRPTRRNGIQHSAPAPPEPRTSHPRPSSSRAQDTLNTNVTVMAEQKHTSLPALHADYSVQLTTCARDRPTHCAQRRRMRCGRHMQQSPGGGRRRPASCGSCWGRGATALLLRSMQTRSTHHEAPAA